MTVTLSALPGNLYNHKGSVGLVGAAQLLWVIEGRFRRGGRMVSPSLTHGVYSCKPTTLLVGIDPTALQIWLHAPAAWSSVTCSISRPFRRTAGGMK